MTELVSDFLLNFEGQIMFGTLIFVLAVAALAEGSFPFRNQTKGQLGRRWIANLSLLILNQVNLGWVIAFSSVILQSLGANDEFGLAYLLGLGFWSSAILALVIFEFINYWFHRALHRYPLLWRIHAVHHCDTELDSTTTFRNHPLELLVIAPFTIPLIYLLGFPAASVILFQVVKAIVLVFAHSNIQISESIERKCRLFIATPDYHRTHHSADRQYTDSNYSTVLPVFDYLFGTYENLERKQLRELKTGLNYLDKPKDTRVDNLLLLPFLWRKMVSKTKTDSTMAQASQNSA